MFGWKIVQETTLLYQLATFISSSNPKTCYCCPASNPSETAGQVYCSVSPNGV